MTTVGAPWKPEEWNIICDIMDQVTGDNFIDAASCIDTLAAKFKARNPASVRTRTGIKTHVEKIAAKLVKEERSRRTQHMLENYREYRAQFRQQHIPDVDGGPVETSTPKPIQSKKRKADSIIELGSDQETDTSGSDAHEPSSTPQGPSLHPVIHNPRQTEITDTQGLDDGYSNTHEATDKSIHASATVERSKVDSQNASDNLPPQGLTEAEWKLIRVLRIPPVNAYNGPVSHSEICRVLNNVLQAADQGIKEYFLPASPSAEFTAFSLSELSRELTRVVFLPRPDIQLEHRLQALFDDPAMTPDIVFRMYTSAAILEWTSMEGELHGVVLPMQLVNAFNLYQDLVGYDMAQRYRIEASMRHLEEAVKPSLPSVAVNLQRKLHIVLNDIHMSTPASLVPGTTPTFALREQRYIQYAQVMQKAFLDCLQLRLKMAQSLMAYVFRCPKVGDEFDSRCMVAANAHNNAEAKDKRVFVTLSPAVSSRERKGGDLIPAVPALVLVEGLPMHVVTSWVFLRE